jgi:transposase InsO family protein
MYKNKSSHVAAGFLYRLRYLVDQPGENLQTDNGSEFAWEFERATARLGIQRYFSRVKTPNDNAEIERFLAYLTPIEYIEKALAKIHSPVSPMWSAITECVLRQNNLLPKGLDKRDFIEYTLSHKVLWGY